VLPALPKTENPAGINDTGGVFWLSPLARLLHLMSQLPNGGEVPKGLPIFNREFRISAGSPGNRAEVQALFRSLK
jgi:hypothetical protein